MAIEYVLTGVLGVVITVLIYEIWQYILLNADKDGSNDVSIEEAYVIAKKGVDAMYAKVDTNNDGKITKDEFASYLKTWKFLKDIKNFLNGLVKTI